MSEASFSKCLMRYSYIHSVLAPLSKCCPHLEGRLLTRYSPVRHLVFTEINTPFDLHVLSTPPAFVLSQDQTLQKIIFRRTDRLFNYLFKKNLLGNLLQSRYRTFVYVRKHIVHCLVFKEHFCFFNSLELTFKIISYVFCFVNNFFKLFYFVCFAVFKTLYFVCCSSATLIIIYHIHKTCQ